MRKYVPFYPALIVGLVILFVAVACKEDEGIEPYQPYYLVINGPTEVAPGETITYSANSYQGETYTWTVPDGAEIVSGDGNDTITVVFSARSSGNLTVSAKGLTETEAIAVKSSLPTPTVNLEDTVLTQGGTRDVIVSFSKDIETAPSITFVADTGTQNSTVAAIERIDARSFRVPYTAGSGNGTDKIEVTEAVSTAFYGAQRDTTVSTFNIYRTDNTPATGILEASRTPATPAQSVTFTATFSEPLYVKQDSVMISIVSANLLTPTTYVNNAVMSTLDGVNWTYEYKPAAGINDLAAVSVTALTDLASNTTVAVEPILIEIKEE